MNVVFGDIEPSVRMSRSNPHPLVNAPALATCLQYFGRVVSIITISVTLAGCGGGNSGGDSVRVNGDGCVLTQAQRENIQHIDDLPPACLALIPIPDDNLLGRLFILGTQVDGATGELLIYANGTDLDGQPLELTDFQAATVSVENVPVAAAVEPVNPGDDILSLGLVTDYSTSINNAELVAISDVYEEILTWLPQVFEGQAINFSNNVVVRQDWTESFADLVAGIQLDNAIVRGNTAFYDALGTALQRDLALDTDGLVERCRPAHMLIAFTDGQDNASSTYTTASLRPVIDDSNTVMIMLGTLTADSNELTALAGSNGAFAYAYDVSSIQAVVRNWSESLSHMVKFTLSPATGFDAGVIEISIPGQTVTVRRPVDSFCEVAP